MSVFFFTESPPFRQRLFHTGQTLHQKQTKWKRLSLNRCICLYNTELCTF